MSRRGSPRRPAGAAAFRWLIPLFLVAAFGFALVAAVESVEELVALWEEVAAYPWRFRSSLLVAAAAASSAALLLTGVAWVRFFRAVGGRIAYGPGTLAWLGTNLGRYIPGKVWQVTGLAVYVRRKGGSGALAVSSSVAVQGVTLLGGLALAAGILGSDLLGATGAVGRTALAGLALCLFLHPAVIRRFTRWLGRWLGESPELGPIGVGEMARLAAGLTAAWVLHGLAFWLFLRGVVGPDAPPPWTATGIFAAAYLTGYAVFLAPAGLVVREGAMAALLVSLTPLGPAVAAAASIGARLWATVSEAAALGAGWVWARSGVPSPEEGEDRGTGGEEEPPPGMGEGAAP